MPPGVEHRSLDEPWLVQRRVLEDACSVLRHLAQHDTLDEPLRTESADLMLRLSRLTSALATAARHGGEPPCDRSS